MFRNLSEARDAIADLWSFTDLSEEEYRIYTRLILMNIRMNRPTRNISLKVLENWRDHARKGL